MVIYVLALVISRCSVFVITLDAIQILQVVPGAAFAALRAYVLSRSKLVGLLILALSLAPAAVNLVPYGYQVSGINYPPFGCLELDNVTDAIGLNDYIAIPRAHPKDRAVVVISRVPLIVADMLLLYITWTKLRSRGLPRDISQSKRLSLSDVLFCDGIVLFVLNILHLVLSLPALGIESHGGSDVTTFTGPLTAILISRFLLDLQEANKATVRVDGDYPLHSSVRDPYNTPSFISSLGAFINPDHPTRSDDELESHVVSRSDEEDKGGAHVSESQAAVVS
ncbi:hypothetical protein K466DRAFT_582826 [Polyporus arcularius HHB13444]|uniref:Uncharacterized protein n=1 Tax=Polyporus arcularius HHB13444 TaxID=1314778 RepID=A0A5C3PPF9_9APHY|nr:hypothetical protein K466DRAFT_582826 [Polyporus arcularius HHB13444]